ncbi:putative epoxide hydrolase [Phyllosticta citribraziliensis]|uniref:Epoxide hydrolase n=1 Tax=Phyllosticta citribraziliensis TaxID=989973 RepID=A0ABR1L2X5_9PEZI
MPPSTKALLFDIGGVVVLSPLAAISAYERALALPPGYINSAIGAAAPHGAFQRLERSEMALDERFFDEFGRDVRNRDVWERITRTNNTNTTTSSNKVPAVGTQQKQDDFEIATARIDARALFWTMMRAARHPDPHVYPALRKLVAVGRARAASADPAAFVVGALSNAVVFPAGVRDERGEPSSSSSSGSGARETSGNETTTAPIAPLFDTFLHSAHIGLRKPDPRVYALALRRLEAVLRERGCLAPDAALRPEEVLFLDDIGGNLKAARAFGFRTCKVEIGRTREAVRVLEGAVGARLLDEADAGGSKL